MDETPIMHLRHEIRNAVSGLLYYITYLTPVCYEKALDELTRIDEALNEYIPPEKP